MNTSRVGDISTAKVLAALLALGRAVWVPWGDSNRGDLAFEEDDGTIHRVQCKTGRLRKGSVWFPTVSYIARSRSGVKTVRRSYRGQVDFFGVYCPETERVYLIPVGDLPVGIGCLRTDPPRNGQRTRIQWAKPYEIGAVAQLGARLDGIQEVTGSTPVGSTSALEVGQNSLF